MRPIMLLICGASILLVLVLWAATLATIRTERDHAVTGALRESRNRSIAYELFVARTFDAADVAALHLADKFKDMPLRQAERPPGVLIDPVAANPLFASVIVTDASGDVRWTTVAGVPATNIGARPTFAELRAGRAPDGLLAKPEVSPYLHRALVTFSRAIRRNDGGFGGMVSIRIPVDHLTDFNRGATIHPHDLISVVRLDGVTLARREGQRTSFGENLAGTQAMRHQMADPNGTYLAPSIFDGIRRYFTHRRLPRYGVFVTIGVGEDAILAGPRERARVLVAAMAALTLAILAFACVTVHGLLRRQRAARSLAAANHRLREAQRLGRIGDWEYEYRTRRMILSEQLCLMYGRDIGDNVVPAREAFAQHDAVGQARMRATVAEAIRTRQPQSCELTPRGPDGTIVHRRVVVAPSFAPDGQVEALFGTEQDITAEKRHEQLRDEVAHMSRVEAVNVMAATIAHELAQPLTAAWNYTAAAALEARRLSQTQDSDISALLEQANRQIGVTSQIIQRARDMMASRGSGDGRASLAEIVDDAVALLRLGDRQCAAAIVEQLDRREDLVAADKIQVQQVVLNLLRNACQASAGDDEPRVVVSSRRDAGGMLLICVEDNGPGIDPAMGDIFSPFVSSGRNGLGVGLSICRAIVDSYGGRIWSDRSASGGAAIRFTLPLVERQVAAA